MPQETLAFSSTFQKLLTGRGLENPPDIETFLFPQFRDLKDPFLMKGMPQAKRRIKQAVKKEEKILIHGDYDVDGITAVVVMAKTLEVLGGHFFTFLPEREKDGYGVSEEAIKKAHQDGVSLIITVDCGITAKKEIEIAKRLGMEAIVIDHHKLSEEGIPEALAILNPLQDDCPYPFKELSAAGLVFKLAQALLGDRALDFLDFIALSTVSDIAPLISENRILVKKGLESLSSRKTVGIQALAKTSGLKARKMNTGHIGFMLAPRLNAAGRMSSADIALRLLLTKNLKEAESLSKVLEEENKARQAEERQVTKEAIQKVESFFNFSRDRIIVVSGKGWHLGVIGIVASRLVDKYYRPAIVISLDETRGRGSGRSIKGFHLFDALKSCKDFLEEFGGHEQAVGLSIDEKNLADFQERINRFARLHLNEKTLTPHVESDIEIELGDLTKPFLLELELLEPYGVGNPRPLFLTKNLKLRSKLRRTSRDNYEATFTDGFVTYQAFLKEADAKRCGAETLDVSFDLVYSVKTRMWNGMETLVLQVKALKTS